jgi:hypothetical protein
MIDKIKLSKSIIYDYFVLQKNNEIPFYFQKDDVDAILQELIELKNKLNKHYRKVKIYCYECGEVLLVLDSNACYCDICNRLFTEDEIRNNCGI